MKTLISHQHLSCKTSDFARALFQPYTEKYLRQYIPKKYLQWTSSARAAISQLVSPGEKVGIPAFTCRVVANALIHAGAQPVFIDAGTIIEQKDIEPIATKINTILVPYNFGFMPNMEKITAFCRKKNIRVIEDCAQALGAISNGKAAGSFGDAAVYSFGISKNIGAMGGMIATDKPFLYTGNFYPLVPRLKSYGKAFVGNIFFQPDIYSWTEKLLTYGFEQEHIISYELPDFAKYIILAQAKRYKNMLALRRSNALFMMHELTGIIDFVKPEQNTEPAWLYFVFLHNQRDGLRAKLLQLGVDVRPLHTFEDVSKRGTKATATEKMHLACALLRPKEEIELVVSTIKSVMKRAGN